MKILISDYSSDLTTEPLYLNTSFNNAGCRSTLLPSSTSIYDGFDITKPDVYLSHHEYLSRDLLLYLQESGTSNIDLIINITGISQENLYKLDSIFNEHNIKPALYFVNRYDHKLTSKTNIITLLYGADVFLASKPKQYDIDHAIFIDDKSQLKEINGSYHYVSHNKNIDKIADIYMPIHRLSHIYNNYKAVIFRYFDGIFTQSFFDAAIRSNAVYFDLDDESKHLFSKNISKLLGDDSFCDLPVKESGEIKRKILNKHTCLHRAKSLLSQLPAKQYIDNLEKIIETGAKT